MEPTEGIRQETPVLELRSRAVPRPDIRKRGAGSRRREGSRYESAQEASEAEGGRHGREAAAEGFLRLRRNRGIQQEGIMFGQGLGQPVGTPTNLTTPSLRPAPQRLNTGEAEEQRYQGLQARLAELEDSLRCMTMMAREGLLGGPRMPQLSPPPPFTGANPRSWLRQIEQYFHCAGVAEDQRLESVICHLTGPALEYYCATMERTPQSMPTDWDGFREFMIRRFGAAPIVSVVQRLREIEFRGDFYEVVQQFSDILATGEQPPEQELIELFVTRFPWHMAEKLAGRYFDTWMDAKDCLEQEYRTRGLWAQRYYRVAGERFKREMEADGRAAGLGWIPQPKAKQEMRGMERRPMGGARPHPRWGEGSTTGPQQGTNGKQEQGPVRQQTAAQQRAGAGTLRCFICKGVGHLARVCPTANLATKKDGSLCHKCGGQGHWAPACPSAGIQRNVNDARPKPEVKAQQQGNGKA